MKLVAVRVPDDWKDRMDKEDVPWSEVLRQAIRDTLDRLDRDRMLKGWLKRPKASSSDKGTAAASIRRDRDAR